MIRRTLSLISRSIARSLGTGPLAGHRLAGHRLPGRRLTPLVLLSGIGLLSALAPSACAGEVAPLHEQVEEIVLDNGLRILVLERDFSPTFAAYYQFGVGGAMDPKDKTGIAHLLEHMMFKGNENIGTLDRAREIEIMDRLQDLWGELYRELDRQEDPFQEADADRIAELRAEIDELAGEHKRIIVKNEYNEILTRAGATRMNASTGNDVTNYFLQLPANQLELWFRTESDRLLRPVFREFYSERDVVHEERRLRTENQAAGLAWEALASLMYKAHPYGRPIVGWPQDIMRYDRRDAEAYFRLYYSPSNCTMVFVGDVDTEQIRRLAETYFGPWERQALPRLHVTAEPEQRGERREVVQFDAEPFFLMGYPTVPAGHPDEHALDLLGRVLGGMASSRLDQALVQEAKVAVSVSTYNGSQRYAGSFEVNCRPKQGHELAELEGMIHDQIDRIIEEGVTTDELERAKVATKVRRVRRLQSNLWLAMTIGRTVGRTGDLAYLEEEDALVMAVTPEDVRRVAAEYLHPERLSVVHVRRPETFAEDGDGPRRGRGRSSGRGGSGGGAGNEGYSGGMTHSRGAPTGPRGTQHSHAFEEALQAIDHAEPIEISIPEVGRDIERTTLPCGMTVYITEDPSLPAVSMSIRFLSGSNSLPVEKLAAFDLAQDLLNEGGTASLTPRELEERIDELGMSFRLWMGSTECGASFWSLSENFSEALALATEMVQQPRLDPERLEVLKGQMVERMRRRYDSPRSGSRTLTRHVLHGDHPRLGFVPSKEEVEAVTAGDIRELVTECLGPRNMYVTVVGDFETPEMLATLEEAFGDWRSNAQADRQWIARPPARKPGVYWLEKDIPQPSITFTQELPLDRTAPAKEHAALEILNEILGGSGFRSRLMERLRSDEGLTYGIYSRLSHEERPGVPGGLSISYQTKSASVLHSIDSVMEEYRKIVNEAVSSAEVHEQIQSWRNRFIFLFESEFYSAARLMGHELDERPYDFDSRQLAEIQSITVEDVSAVARKYLDPQHVTITIFGDLPPEDTATLENRFGLVRLEKENVFTGGY